MEIEINKKKIRNKIMIPQGFKYDIYCQEKQIRFARSQLQVLWFMTHIYLCSIEGAQSLLTLARRFSIFRTNYDIQFNSGRIAKFRTILVWKGHYQCKYANEIYDIYSHRGRKYSVYKNNSQIAWWDQKSVMWFEGNNYKILADDDCDIDIIISFFLIIDDWSSNNSDSATVTIDFGYIGPQAKEFNPHWRPNKES